MTFVRKLMAAAALLTSIIVSSLYSFDWPFVIAILAVAALLDLIWNRWIRRDVQLDTPTAPGALVTRRHQFRLASLFEVITCGAVVVALAPYFVFDLAYPLSSQSPFEMEGNRREAALREKRRDAPSDATSKLRREGTLESVPLPQSNRDYIKAQRAKALAARFRLPPRLTFCALALCSLPFTVGCAALVPPFRALWSRSHRLWFSAGAVSLLVIVMPLGLEATAIGATTVLAISRRLSSVGVVGAILSLTAMVLMHWGLEPALRRDALRVTVLIFHQLVFAAAGHAAFRIITGSGHIADAYTLPFTLVIYSIVRHMTYWLM
ncbi:MAG: hypothetical protein K2Y37_09435 [Pirellulales bacterium]|nr:hypothetical protein [Pirellulales bacterium]